MNGPAVFLSHSCTDEVAVDVIEQALHGRGLAVFRDQGIQLFDHVTDTVGHALDSSAVLLAFYSRRYPVRFASQWVFTRAFLAARRLGDPADRVLVVNPEPDGRHIVPIDIGDDGCFSWRNDSDAGRLADAVAAKVERAAGPLGGVPRSPSRPLGPRRFAGRYAEMWSVHSELHGDRRPGAAAAVVVEAPAGMGKTVLAEQYSLVFRDAYPGGVVWTSAAGADQLAGHFAAAVSEVARQRLGLNLSGMRPRQARVTLAERITEDLLWVIDDVPDGLDPRTLNDLIIPSAKVHTLLTMRTVPPRWLGGVVTLAGLTTVEEHELVRAHRYESVPHQLVDLVEIIRACSPHARLLLAFASMLARAPISGETLVRGVSGLLGLQAPTLVAEALDELDRYGLLDRVAGTTRQFWRLNSLVAAAARQDLAQILTSSFIERAARILAKGLAEASLDLCTHALEVASNASVPLSVRLSLLRAVATRHQDHGDIPAAREVRDRALQGEWQFQDAAAAARLALLAGEAETALLHTGMLIDRATAERDIRGEFQARLIAATAHDDLGDYPKADAVFHQHDLVREHGPTPVWLSEVDRQWAALARVRSLRLRGEYRAARQVLDGLLPAIQQAHPTGTCQGTWPVGTVELARLQLSAGQATEAQATAQRVLSVFTDAGVVRHHLAREAVAILAEGELTAALPEMLGRPEQWASATKRVRQALDESVECYGADSPLTLELMVLHGRALINSGEYWLALTVLVEVERRTAAVLGVDHPIALRARQWIGLATMGRKDWKAATVVFEQLLPRQDAVLGRGHPESQLTRFQLGTCLLKQNNLKRARVPGPLLRIIDFLEDCHEHKD